MRDQSNRVWRAGQHRQQENRRIGGRWTPLSGLSRISGNPAKAVSLRSSRQKPACDPPRYKHWLWVSRRTSPLIRRAQTTAEQRSRGRQTSSTTCMAGRSFHLRGRSHGQSHLQPDGAGTRNGHAVPGITMASASCGPGARRTRTHQSAVRRARIPAAWS